MRRCCAQWHLLRKLYDYNSTFQKLGDTLMVNDVLAMTQLRKTLITNDSVHAKITIVQCIIYDHIYNIPHNRLNLGTPWQTSLKRAVEGFPQLFSRKLFSTLHSSRASAAFVEECRNHQRLKISENFDFDDLWRPRFFLPSPNSSIHFINLTFNVLLNGVPPSHPARPMCYYRNTGTCAG